METTERIEQIRHRHKRAKDNIAQIIKVLTAQKIIAVECQEMLMNNLNGVEDDPYNLILDLDGKNLDIENGAKQKYRLEIRVTQQK